MNIRTKKMNRLAEMRQSCVKETHNTWLVDSRPCAGQELTHGMFKKPGETLAKI
eukprot:gene5110-15331_t